ncbi:aminopeptidase [Terrilactibacillus sp. BCM23-1]|uniref:Aminopeptidase n=1 Tax=Terrilactibacillus tamarindi TaxID=2599694 RepID=A0A6N8CL82_9BACI|nr:aminopeptidase [Terrilactibacillus tamarindi]MTT30481.1 aminopeptidase [Terrilactibacillus tamarindi]
MISFEDQFTNYAKLAIKIGINLQKGQDLVIIAPVKAIQFVEKVTEIAYQEGAKHVYFDWTDHDLQLTKLTYAPNETFKEYPTWKAKGFEKLASEGAAFLLIRTPSLDLFSDIDPTKLETEIRTENQALFDYREYRMSDKVSWNIIAVPSDQWALKLFPNEDLETATKKLWKTLFKMTRADQDDPIGAWEKHQKTLEEKMNYLNEKKYHQLHYTAPGTDLTITFDKDYLWAGGAATNQEGHHFMPNIPTEEVFTLPLKTGVNGTVTSTLPLNYNGTLIEKISLTFKDGRIIEAHADKGEETLKRLINTDDGSHYLGEVALVPYNSPISQSGMTFFMTLFDENASCHLAIGKAYPKCLENGANMTREELDQHGANTSLVHVDFMVGSEELSIDGITNSGEREPVFRQGLWAF